MQMIMDALAVADQRPPIARTLIMRWVATALIDLKVPPHSESLRRLLWSGVLTFIEQSDADDEPPVTIRVYDLMFLGQQLVDRVGKIG